ncbi:hypothetical protein SAMN04515647_2321 [Cohaesibacter sp. ES.047]|uniref:hypothetical protein n=1 Tax=Cohaesibacter sp. ES.047 TaxID=1798205 RepID=UPI000BB96D58|nr:hypothetical protein [Cohaesibacter sp. ES.047]SNY92074.1 hypothetical protein SAMN04515647_2321 [Cohaesibacter sp. ES.047]
MDDTKSQFLTFLDQIYGHAAIEQISTLTGLDGNDLAKASDVFVPTFLTELMKTFGPDGDPSPPLETSRTTPNPFWPEAVSDAMASLLEQGASSAAASSASGQDRHGAFPMDLIAGQSAAMESLYQVFMGQMAQARLMEDARRATGLSRQQLSELFPLLTTYSLLPLSPRMMMPAMDDPAGWMDYWGDFTRRTFRQASEELEAMPSPLHAAFDGLLAGFYPDATKAEAPEKEPDPAQEMRDATLELQTQYLKGLNSLFEHYQPKMAGR